MTLVVFGTLQSYAIDCAGEWRSRWLDTPVASVPPQHPLSSTCNHRGWHKAWAQCAWRTASTRVCERLGAGPKRQIRCGCNWARAAAWAVAARRGCEEWHCHLRAAATRVRVCAKGLPAAQSCAGRGGKADAVCNAAPAWRHSRVGQGPACSAESGAKWLALQVHSTLHAVHGKALPQSTS